MYAMVSTRTDISHGVGVVSRYMENPCKENWAAVKWVLRYLRGTSDYCITYKSGCESVYRYVDFDFAVDLEKRRSTSGYVFTLLNMPTNFPESVDMSRFSGAYFVVVCSTKSTNLV
jgi:hypothetical protein